MDVRSRACAAIAVYAMFGPDRRWPADAAGQLGISDSRFRWLLLLATRGLPEGERIVFVARMGLAGDPPWTLAETSLALGVSRERVREIEQTALRRLSPDWRRMVPDGAVMFGPN